jgi:Uma2 family endonuclease
LDAIDHLPEGGTLVFQNVSWEDYERLVEDLAERHFRVTYDRGKLEIKSPLSEHERMARIIERALHIYCEEKEVTLESYGNTTWKLRSLARGLEPDGCYYVANAHQIIGKKRNLDLELDPPPDICVEIDIANESLSKFSIYAALGVPEIWRFEKKRAHFYELVRKSYREIPESRFITGLKAQLLVDAIQHCETEGQTVALRAFRQKLRR